jgi:predicted nucleic acid-binding protein
MRHLLDVNALIAYGFRRHDFHDHVGSWIQSRKGDRFLTCSITELGFVRVLGSVRAYGIDVVRAKELLLDLKSRTAMPLEFIPDANDLASLPMWVKTTLQVTDGHLVELAKTNNAVLATLDQGIPGAFVIPSHIDAR